MSSALIYDHIDNEIFIVSDDISKFSTITSEIESDLANLPILEEEKISGTVEILFKGSPEEHQMHVKKCIDYIFQGEIFQANLSRLWNFKINNNLKSYRYL